MAGFFATEAAMPGRAAAVRGPHRAAGLLFAGMAVVSLVGVMQAAWVADHLGRKWTIMPSCLGLAASLLLMAATRAPPAISLFRSLCSRELRQWRSV